ncbi:MAG: hypothetical protein DRP42_06035, partial [Tenericutes bacterium]
SDIEEAAINNASTKLIIPCPLACDNGDHSISAPENVKKRYQRMILLASEAFLNENQTLKEYFLYQDNCSTL